jgi:aminopeptidase N
MALTQERAAARGLAIERGSIFYDFHVALEKGENYSGFSELSFNLLSIPEEFFIDFKGSKVESLIVNGESIAVNVVDGFILIDVSKIKVGANVVGVQYSNSYNNDGSGCVSFTDVDTKQYIYTQFEPYYANRVFPCFDQPDLKATLRLNVISPSDWKKVLSNEYATVEKEFNAEEYLQNVSTTLKDQLTAYLQGKSGFMTIFPKTKLLPSYLYCFIAGEYLELKLEESQVYNVHIHLFRTSPCLSTALSPSTNI